MSKINLLPWREKERERKNREFLIQLIVCTLLALLLAFAAWTYFNMQLESQNQANEIVKQANTGLDRKLEEIKELEKTKEDIISRMKIIQDLQGKRPISVHVFDTLVKTMPDTLFYNRIQRKGNLLILSGRADNPNTISDLLRNIDKSNWLANAKVQKIINNGNENAKNSEGIVNEGIAPEEGYISFQMTAEIEEKSKNEQKTSDNENQKAGA